MIQILYTIYGLNIRNSISNPIQRNIQIKNNLQTFLLIGLDPDRSHETERFFDYCHEDVVKAPGIAQKEQNTQPQQDSKWFRLFKD